jgi:hypothetical protein
MFVRYVTSLRDPISHQHLGIIAAAWEHRHHFEWGIELRIESLIDWFNDHLRVPRRFTRSRRKNAASRAICWFKESASLHIAMARVIAQTLDEVGIATTALTTRKPGYIVYEDRHQVAAIPFRDTIE